ncbi:NAD(P)/FAD-dependent oxidoreductase [Candidatus Woesearchaeota archaeon]|nr:NAD(P)/FAD-dependent oxidoreductase [Candidatus Woesearchaeota archaeon]
MKKKVYDVVIVGAGVSGLMLSKLLSDSNLDIILVEERKDIKFPLNFIFGTFKETVTKFKLQKYVVGKWKTFVFHNTKEKASKKYQDYAFQAVDMRLFAKDITPKIKTKTNLKVIRTERKDHILGIIDKKGNKIFGKIVVDCTGGKQVISKLLGINTKNVLNYNNISYELKNCNIPDYEMVIIPTDLTTCNVGMWIYPFSKGKCQIGHAHIFSDEFPNISNQEKTFKQYIRNTEPYRGWFKNMEIESKVNQVSGTTLLSSLVEDNYISIGDAAGTTTPQFGEGFRPALETALIASNHIKKAFKNNNFSKKYLKKYENEIRKTLGSKYFWGKFARFLLLRGFTNKEYNIFTKRLNTFSNEDFRRFFKTDIDLKYFVKLFTPKLLLLIIINLIKFSIFGNLNKKSSKIKYENL